MAPSQSRQILAWTLPTIVIVLSYLWFKRKRLGVKSDPNSGGSEQAKVPESKSLKDELEEALAVEAAAVPFSRSLSGVDSTPIDIIIPRELRSHKSNPVVISDEDLDLEIEKIKSMKSLTDPFNKSQAADGVDGALRTTTTGKDKPKKKQARQAAGPEVNVVKSSTPVSLSPGFHRSPKVIKCSPQKIVSSCTSPMAQKNVQSIEEQFGALKLSTQVGADKAKAEEATGRSPGDHEELQRQSSERDSANHSPADVMLASPSLSSISDNHSEGSNDSGKGGSDVATPPSRTPAGDGSISGDIPHPVMYEFVIPPHLVGRLIGRQGCNINDIKEKTRTHIIVRKHPTNPKMKLCVMEGTQMEIDSALQLIREKFPLKRYPEVTLEQVCVTTQLPAVSLTPDQLYLKLVEGVNNDTIVSCVVSPNHFFLQQPTHPSFPNLNVLSGYMNICYGASDSPLLPNPIPDNTVCAAQFDGDWYRTMVLSTDSETSTSHVIFLDYGGYSYIENSKLRQIRGDFLLLPFQASECYLANIRPIGGEENEWSEDAYSFVEDLTKGSLTYTQIAEYTEDGVPLVLMYILTPAQEIINLNQELVNRGLAEWTPLPQQDETEGAVGGIVS